MEFHNAAFMHDFDDPVSPFGLEHVEKQPKATAAASDDDDFGKL